MVLHHRVLWKQWLYDSMTQVKSGRGDCDGLSELSSTTGPGSSSGGSSTVSSSTGSTGSTLSSAKLQRVVEQLKALSMAKGNGSVQSQKLVSPPKDVETVGEKPLLPTPTSVSKSEKVNAVLAKLKISDAKLNDRVQKENQEPVTAPKPTNPNVIPAFVPWFKLRLQKHWTLLWSLLTKYIKICVLIFGCRDIHRSMI